MKKLEITLTSYCFWIIMFVRVIIRKSHSLLKSFVQPLILKGLTCYFWQELRKCLCPQPPVWDQGCSLFINYKQSSWCFPCCLTGCYEFASCCPSYLSCQCCHECVWLQGLEQSFPRQLVCVRCPRESRAQTSSLIQLPARYAFNC